MHAPACLGTSILAATSPDAVADVIEKAWACGPPGKQAWICSTTFDLTGSRYAASVMNDLRKPIRIVVVLVIAFLVVRILRWLIRRVVERLARPAVTDRIETLRRRTGLALLDTSPVPSVRRRLRAETIGAVLRSVASVIVWATAIVMVLDTLGVNLAPLFAGAGIIGIAFGFGAQSLVRDFLSGMFMLIEDQYGVGDVIDAGPATGTVEGVSLRTTRLRDVQGIVWHVPNGQILRVGNQSQQWSRALLDIAVPADTDVPAAVSAIRTAAESVWHDEAFRPLILSEPEVWGVEDLGLDQLVIRLVVKTRPLEQWRVARELRARVKASLDAAGVANDTGEVARVEDSSIDGEPGDTPPDR